MFTGIVTDIGIITKTEEKGDLRAIVACSWDPAGIDIGASIACSGVWKRLGLREPAPNS